MSRTWRLSRSSRRTCRARRLTLSGGHGPVYFAPEPQNLEEESCFEVDPCFWSGGAGGCHVKTEPGGFDSFLLLTPATQLRVLLKRQQSQEKGA